MRPWGLATRELGDRNAGDCDRMAARLRYGSPRMRACGWIRRRDRAAGVAARSIAATLEQLGPTYVKLGQILATRRDLLPDDVVVELERLQDQLAPAPFDAVPRFFRDELGLELDDVFAELDPVPIASASIACVYRGTLRDGTPVAVGSAGPGVAQLVDLDLRLIRRGARLLSPPPGSTACRCSRRSTSSALASTARSICVSRQTPTDGSAPRSSRSPTCCCRRWSSGAAASRS